MNKCNVVRDVKDLEVAIKSLKPPPERLIGDILVADGVITGKQLEQAFEYQKSHQSDHIGKILIDMGYAAQPQISLALGQKFGIPYVQLHEFSIDPKVLSLVPTDIALQYNALPLADLNGMLIVAMEDPLNWEARDIIQFHANKNVEVVIASASDISETLSKYYSLHDVEVMDELELELNPANDTQPEDAATDSAEKAAQQKPIVRLLNAILLQAVLRGASDINIRPEKDRVNVYYRVDGKLHFVRSLGRSMLPALVSRIKITGQMNIAERHMPQDGHARLRKGSRDIDLRISVIPTVTGESVVIRILDTDVGLKPLEDIGFSAEELINLRDIITRPYGMFLVTGPTGSGKSTTLYAVLNEIKRRGPHIITVEDPVEYRMHGVEQIQVSNVRGYTFAESLRHILRHDPDVIMVGEIRDLETARIANKAALTGHVVLTTLHTNDAASAITRLVEMGIEPYLLANTLLGSMAQRLIRLNCQACKAEEEVDLVLRTAMGVGKDEVFYRGLGCPSCNNTGYHNRVAVCELLPISEEIRHLVAEGSDTGSIKALAVKQGMLTLTQHAINMARKGETSFEEAYSVRLD